MTLSEVTTFCLALLCLEAVVTGVVTRRFVRSFLLLAAYSLGALLLHVLTGYPRPQIAFGGGPSLALVIVMFVCILLGMSARYWFYLRGRFSLPTFLRPLLVSPLVLLPLLGTLSDEAQPRTVQLASLAILAFQNGFFWRTVFEKAKP